ncbi:MAG: hypothetical protein IJN42_00065, partial [Clostridia bacterium]|nr:hypothetical protein [Clostridia bacterium]
VGKKPGFFCNLGARIASGAVVPLMRSLKSVAVYRDSGEALKTMRQGLKYLEKGESLMLWPDVEYTGEYGEDFEIYSGFLFLGELYYKRTGKELSFVPLYIAPNLKKMYLGKPIQFSAAAPIAKERRRICDYLMKEITDIAVNLPEHTVIPYRNIPKKYYPKNIQTEGQNEETTS